LLGQGAAALHCPTNFEVGHYGARYTPDCHTVMVLELPVFHCLQSSYQQLGQVRERYQCPVFIVQRVN